MSDKPFHVGEVERELATLFPDTEDPEWVALFTGVERSDADDTGMFWEAGGIYPDSKRPQNLARQAARRFEPGEHVAVCPRCGQRFAATEDATAELHRDLHCDGDEDIPSICRNMRARLRLVVDDAKGGA